MNKIETMQALALGVKLTLADELFKHLPADAINEAVAKLTDIDNVTSWDIAMAAVDILAEAASGEKANSSKKKKSSGTKTSNAPQIASVTIFTDGACIKNPGPGGWGAIINNGDSELEISGSCEQTTNNRMELTGAIRALEKLGETRQKVAVFTDSRYLVQGIENGWAKNWRKNGWMKADKKPALNSDLWEKLLSLCEKHEVRFHWVKGHADNEKNNRCDQLATREAARANRNKYTTD